MVASANHHYVPKAILKNFTFSGGSVFYLERKLRSSVQRRNINSIFKKRHLNTYISRCGKRDDRLENFLSNEFDAKIGSVIDDVRRYISGSAHSIEPISKAFVVQFIYTHSKRTPEFYEAFDTNSMLQLATYRATLKLPIGHPLYGKGPEDVFDSATREEMVRNAVVANIGRQSESILNLLFQMKVSVCSPEDRGMSFVIGTNPVVRTTHNNDENLITGDVEMWATMAPDLAFVLSKRGFDGDLHYLSSERVIRLNSAIYKQSRAVAARSKETLQILPAMA